MKSHRLEPAEGQRRRGAPAGREEDRRAALRLVLAAGRDAGAHDLRVECAGQAAVARDQRTARRLAPTRARVRIGRLGTRPAASAASRVIRRIASAYGRSASMRCSARRRRAAATISMARVIVRMFWTDAMRLRTSRCEAMLDSHGGLIRVLSRLPQCSLLDRPRA